MTKKASEHFLECRETRQVRRSALSDPRFRRYYPVSWFSSLGAWLLRFLLGWSAWDLTHSATWVGLVSALMLAPALLLSPWFGILSDRVNPRHGLRFSMVLHSGIAMLGAIAASMAMYDRTALACLAALLGIATSIHSPMRLALVPLLVSREALPSAVGYSAMSFNTARMIGPALGAAVVAHLSVASAWIMAALMFAVSFIGLSLLSLVYERPEQFSTSLWRQFQDGYRYLLYRADLRLLLALTALNGLLGRTMIELLPALSGQLLAGDSTDLATLVAMAGLGSLLGGFLVSRQSPDLDRLLILVCAAIALAAVNLISLQWFAGTVGLACWVTCLSVMTTLAGTGSQTLIQLVTDKEYRGRVMSIWTMLTLGAPACGAAVLGVGVDGLGFARISLLAGAVGLGLVALSYARRARVLSVESP